MIRKAKQSEIIQLMALTQACAKKMEAEGIFQWNEEYPNKAAFKNDEDRGELYVLCVNEAIVGCITISTRKDDEYNEIDWLTPDDNNFYVHRLAIHPDAQHQGYAKSLMDFAEKIAREHDALSVRLDTFSRNKRNQKFYENRAYQRLGDVYFPRQTQFPFHCYELVL